MVSLNDSLILELKHDLTNLSSFNIVYDELLR